MSTAIKCDRCDKLAEQAIGDVSFEDYHVVTNIQDTGNVFEGYTVDLCSECSAEFLAWVKHDPT